jgi:signal transduction histidine kinase
MFSSLRIRLLASYLLLLVGTMAGILAALFVATSAQPAPVQPIYANMEQIVNVMPVGEIINAPSSDLPNFSTNRPPELDNNAGAAIPPPILSDQELQSFEALLDQIASDQEVRLLLIEIPPGRDSGRIIYDTYERDTQEPIQVELDDYGQDAPPYVQDNLETPPFIRENIFGSFIDGDREWLFGGSLLVNRSESVAFIAAQERPTQSLQTTLTQFGDSWVSPLLQAGAIGIGIALLLSTFISQTIAQPLQRLGQGAKAIARGDLSYRVPVSGPTEIQAVAEAFNTMSAEVLATQQAQQDFTANLTHDLKTPLTSIQGYSQAIIDGAAKNPATAAEVIHEEAERLTRMVNELTDLARMQAGQLPMHLETIDIRQLVQAVTHNLSVVAQNKGLQLRAKLPPLPSISGDGDRLVQALNNLIGNAIKYTPQGGWVSVIAFTKDDGIVIRVQDNGIGIPEKDLSRIFERFYQVDKTRGPTRGTGLGLAITYEIVQAHHGRINVDSHEGQGTTFTLWLPCRQSEKVMSV